MRVVFRAPGRWGYQGARRRVWWGGTVHMWYRPGSTSTRYERFFLDLSQSHGNGAASVRTQIWASSTGPSGPRITPVRRTPLIIVTAMPPTSAERTSTMSASPLESRPLAHCGSSFPPGGPVTSSLYTSERTSMENFPSPALRAQVGDADTDGGCAHTSASVTAAPFSPLITPLIFECGSSWTTLVASASRTSAQVLPTARRVGARGVTIT